MRIMKEKCKFNYNNLNTDIFESKVDLDEFLDTPQDEDVILEECKKYDQLEYPIKLHKVSEETEDLWVAEHPNLPGCITHGGTKQEALSNLEDAKRGWIYARIMGGESIPEPEIEQETRDVSGRILLRIPKELHLKISQMAKANSVSINQELLYLVSCALGEASVTENLIEKIDDLKDILQDTLSSKKNKDMDTEYSILIQELKFKIKQQVKTKSSDLYFDENQSVFEQSKKHFKNLVYKN